MSAAPIMEAEDIIRAKDLEIRRLKEQRNEAEAWAHRLLTSLDEALATIRSLKQRLGQTSAEAEELRGDPSRMDYERADGRAW